MNSEHPVNTIYHDVADYYSKKLAEFGECAKGVDWNSEEVQVLRFEQLFLITGQLRNYSLTDLGCGYGAMYDYLVTLNPDVVYHGVDISKDMIDAANRQHAHHPKARFTQASEPDRITDFCVASGIFNVKLGRSNDEWAAYLLATLDVLNRNSSRGFAFNCLTSYSDQEKMRADLYYADPLYLFDLCKRKYSRHVSLIHDYGLYEFTILVRKT